MADIIARRRRERHRRSLFRTLGIVAGLVVLAVAMGVGLNLWRAKRGVLSAPGQFDIMEPAASGMADQRTGAGVTRSTQTAGGDGGNAGSQGAWQGRQWELPVVVAEPMPVPDWQVVDKLADWPSEVDMMTVRADQLLRQQGETVMYSAALTVRSGAIIEQAVLRLSLVDELERVYGELALPVNLLSRRQARTIAVAMPMGMYDRLYDVIWRVEQVQTLPQGVWIEDIIVERSGEVPSPVLQMTAYNPLHMELADIQFVVAGLNSRGEEVAWWQLRWDRPVAPRQRVQFRTQVQVGSSLEVVRWRVAGVGRRLPEDAVEHLEPETIATP